MNTTRHLFALNGKMLNLANTRWNFVAFWPPDRPDAVSSLWFIVLPAAPGAMTGTANWVPAWILLLPILLDDERCLFCFLPERRTFGGASSSSLNPSTTRKHKMLNVNKWTKTKCKPKQHSSLRTAHVCVCISLCTTVVHNTTQNSSHNCPSYPPDNHHSLDDVYCRAGGTLMAHWWQLALED